jgi:hypothetical protein
MKHSPFFSLSLSNSLSPFRAEDDDNESGQSKENVLLDLFSSMALLG